MLKLSRVIQSVCENSSHNTDHFVSGIILQDLLMCQQEMLRLRTRACAENTHVSVYCLTARSVYVQCSYSL